jgi:hypothetical protein
MKIVDSQAMIRLKPVATLNNIPSRGLQSPRELRPSVPAITAHRSNSINMAAAAQKPGDSPSRTPKSSAVRRQSLVQPSITPQQNMEQSSQPSIPEPRQSMVQSLLAPPRTTQPVVSTLRLYQPLPSPSNESENASSAYSSLKVKTKEQLLDLEEQEALEAKQRAAKKAKRRLQQLAYGAPSQKQRSSSMLPNDASFFTPSQPMLFLDKASEKSSNLVLDEMSAAHSEAGRPSRQRRRQQQATNSGSMPGPGVAAVVASSNTEEEAHMRRQARRSRRMDRSMQSNPTMPNEGTPVDYRNGIAHQLAHFDNSSTTSSQVQGGNTRQIARDGPGSRRFDYVSSPDGSPMRSTPSLLPTPAALPPSSSSKNQFPAWH